MKYDWSAMMFLELKLKGKMVDIKIIKENLCAYDKRSPYFDEEIGTRKGNCFCDNCFYGRTWMAELLLEFMEKNNES